MRCRIAVEDVLAPLDGVAFLQMERLALRDEVLDRLGRLVMRLDDDAALVLVVASEPDRAIDLGDDGVILGTTRLEQFRHARQTAGDVLGLGAFERNTRQHVARSDLLARLDRDNRIDRQQVAGVAATLELGHLALAGNGQGRPQAVTTLVGTPVDDDALGEAGRLVGLSRRPKRRRPDPRTPPRRRLRPGSDGYRGPIRPDAGRA